MKKTYIAPDMKISKLEPEQMLAASFNAKMDGTQEDIILDEDYHNFSAGSKGQNKLDGGW